MVGIVALTLRLIDGLVAMAGSRDIPPILEAGADLVGPVTTGGLVDRPGPERLRGVLVHEGTHAVRPVQSMRSVPSSRRSELPGSPLR